MSLSEQARDIWWAGVESVRAERLVCDVVRREGDRLTICGEVFSVGEIERIVVVGGGKAGAGMAAAIESILAGEILENKVTGWVNVPADCACPLEKIVLHRARPAGVNEPTAAGVEGSERILEIVADLGRSDLCLVLLSGGGSALLPAPVSAISLADKQAVTRFLMHAGATINELNTVRKHLSRIKGGGLARASTAGRTIALIISDVVDDPLDVIASGPTVEDRSTDADALAVLHRHGAKPPAVPRSVFEYLERRATHPAEQRRFPETISSEVIGNNQVAASAAAQRARERGYAVHLLGSSLQGEANSVGRELAELCRRIRDTRAPLAPPVCVIGGGEPIVHVVPTDKPRRGGRNQQLVLSALESFGKSRMDRIVILSGGTDGEDGPTDAAGAWVDAEIQRSAREKNLLPEPFLAINDSYTFFETCGGLLKTGPTHTNVMDLRVALIAEC